MNRFLSPDARLLGLSIWPKRLTDAEYIERIRKRQRLSRWGRILYGIFGVVATFICVWLVQKALDLIVQAGVAPGQRALVQGAFLLAAFVGFGFGWMIYGFLHSAINLIVESRRDRMLVECWDLLHHLMAERETVTDAVTASARADYESK